MRNVSYLLSVVALGGGLAMAACTNAAVEPGTAGQGEVAPVAPIKADPEAIAQLIAQLPGSLTWAEVNSEVTGQCPDCAGVLSGIESKMQLLVDSHQLGDVEPVAVALLAGKDQPTGDISKLVLVISQGGSSVSQPAPGGNNSPGVGGSKPGGSGDASDLAGALASLGSDSKYVRLEYVKEACGTAEKCLSEYEAVESSFKAACATVDCGDAALAALLFGKAPTAAQEQAGLCPSNACVQIGDLKDLIENAQSGGGGEGAIAPQDPGAVVIEALADVPGSELTWTDLETAFETKGCDECVKALVELKAEILAAQDSKTLTPEQEAVATAALGGETFSKEQFANLIEAVAP